MYKKLVILDYSKSGIHYYNVAKNTDINDEYIERLGFNLDECSWMLGYDIDIFEHNGILM